MNIIQLLIVGVRENHGKRYGIGIVHSALPEYYSSSLPGYQKA